MKKIWFFCLLATASTAVYFAHKANSISDDLTQLRAEFLAYQNKNACEITSEKLVVLNQMANTAPAESMPTDAESTRSSNGETSKREGSDRIPGEIVSLPSQFLSEARDQAWAAATEARINKILLGSELAGKYLTNVECRKMSCKFDFGAADFSKEALMRDIEVISDIVMDELEKEAKLADFGLRMDKSNSNVEFFLVVADRKSAFLEQ
ncbi:MAG: hypothetical protein ACK4E7_05785 [Permianibacter sp.]